MSKEELHNFQEEVVGEKGVAIEIIVPGVELVNIEDLQVDGNNPNRMSEVQRTALKEGMKKFGFIVPIITNKDLLIADGQNRWEIAQELGMEKVPVIRLPVSDVDRRILRQVLNKLKGEHDIVLDDSEFKHILQEGSFDELQRLLGESDKKLVSFLASIEKGKIKEDDFDVDASFSKPKYEIKKGDVFLLGIHRVMCGDACDVKDVGKLLLNEKADMAFTDPPYNFNYDQDKSPQGKPIGSLGKIENDNLSPEEFEAFIHKALQNLLENIEGGAYVCMSCKEWATIMRVFESIGGHWSSTIIWNKSSFVMGRSDYHRKFEPILYGWREGEKHYFTSQRTMSDVWDIDKPQKNDLHPTMKPIELCGRAIQNSSIEGNIVLDLFGGSGSTLIACEQLNRKARVMEIDPKYVSVIIERWEKTTGKTAEKL